MRRGWGEVSSPLASSPMPPWGWWRVAHGLGCPCAPSPLSLSLILPLQLLLPVLLLLLDLPECRLAPCFAPVPGHLGATTPPFAGVAYQRGLHHLVPLHHVHHLVGPALALHQAE